MKSYKFIFRVIGTILQCIIFYCFSVKEAITKNGGVKNVSISKPLLQSVKGAHAKSVVEQRVQQDNNTHKAQKKVDEDRKRKEVEEINTLDLRIR